MASEPQSGSILPIVLIIAAVWFFASRGQSPVEPTPPKPEPDVVQPVDQKKPTEAECWGAFATAVEGKLLGGMNQQHTDHLLKIADGLKASGSVTNVSRLDAWRSKRTEITDSNRAVIAATIRGK